MNRYKNTKNNMWYLRFIVHRRSWQMNQYNPVQAKEMEVLKKDVTAQEKKVARKKDDGLLKKQMTRKGKNLF